MNKYKRCNYILLWLFLFAFDFIATAQKKTEVPDLDHILKSALSDSAKTNLLNDTIKYYSSKGSDSALIIAKQGFKLFTDRKYKDGQAWMILAQADYDDTHGSTLAANEKAQYALTLFKGENDNAGMAQTYNLLGAIEDKKGNFNKAIEYLIDELNACNKTNDKDGILRSWTNIGSAYDDNHDTAKAMEYYNKADSISKTLPLSQNVIAINNNLGTFYFNKRDTLKAFTYFRKVLQLSNKPEYMITYVKAEMNMGVMNMVTGEKGKGKMYLYDALARTKQYNLPDQETTIWMNLAYFFSDKPIDTLISYIDTAYSLVKITGNKIKERFIYDAFATLYERDNNYKKANEYLKLERGLTDSMYTVDKEKEIANIVSVYELKLSAAKVHDLEMLVKKNQVQKDIIIGIAALIILLASILLYYFSKAKRLNHHLEEGRKKLSELNTMKDKLFSVIGHDMRGPMANISVIIEMIEHDLPIPDEYREALTMLKEHTNITIETLDKLLLMGKQYIKGDNFNPENFNAKKQINKNLELISYDATKKNIIIQDHTSAELLVFADTGHFDFIIRNLLTNAIKFSFAGGKVEIDADENSVDGFIVFSVKDHGIGIDENTLSHIFTASVTSTFGTNRETGNGIALMLCKDFITLNSGKIWVESKKGEGTTFYFSLKKA